MRMPRPLFIEEGVAVLLAAAAPPPHYGIQQNPEKLSHGGLATSDNGPLMGAWSSFQESD
jgi:hypothetical protein